MAIVMWFGNPDPVHITNPPPISHEDHTHEELVAMHHEHFGVPDLEADPTAFDPATDEPEMLAARLNARKIRNKVGEPVETLLVFPDEYDDDEIMQVLHAHSGLWNEVSDAPAPSWIDGDDDHLVAHMVRKHTRAGHEVGTGKPDDWQGRHHGYRAHHEAEKEGRA